MALKEIAEIEKFISQGWAEIEKLGKPKSVLQSLRVAASALQDRDYPAPQRCAILNETLKVVQVSVRSCSIKLLYL